MFEFTQNIVVKIVFIFKAFVPTADGLIIIVTVSNDWVVPDPMLSIFLVVLCHLNLQQLEVRTIIIPILPVRKLTGKIGLEKLNNFPKITHISNSGI